MNDVISVSSGVSARNGGGFVTIRWGDMGGQLSPEEARQHALAVIEAADAAEHDAAVVAFMLSGKSWPADPNDLETWRAFELLAAIRNYRNPDGAYGSARSSVTPENLE